MRSDLIHGLMFVLPMYAASGCGLYFSDDDSAARDAAPDAIPAPGPDAGPCGFYKCSLTNAFQLDEGGEIRLERSQRGSEDTYVQAQAFFFHEQDPPWRVQVGEEIAGFDGTVHCYDMPGDAVWGHGPSPEGQAIADTRAYLDVGATVTLASGDTQIVLPRQPEGSLDPWQGLQHDIVYVAEPIAALEPGISYAPVIDGSAEYPTLELLDAVSVTMDSEPEPRLFMPPGFSLTQPAEADFFANGVTLLQGNDTAFTWTSQAWSVPNIPRQLPFVLFMTEEDVREVFCVNFSLDEHDGITVPAEVLDTVSPTGKLAVGTFTHVGSIQGRYETRLDLIAIDSKVAPYTITAAQ